MQARKQNPGTPNRQVASARNGRQATRIVAARPSAWEIERRQCLRAGFLMGLALGLLIMCAVLWLWVIPTMDGAVRDAQEAVSAASYEVVA